LQTISRRLDTVEKHHAAVQSRVAAMEKHHTGVQARVEAMEKRRAGLAAEDKALLRTYSRTVEDVKILDNAIYRMMKALVEVEHWLNGTRRVCRLKPIRLSFPPDRERFG